MFFSWIDVMVLALWIFFIIILLNSGNLLNLLIICELIWISFFVYSAFLAAYFDDLFIFLIGLYLLSVATSETTIGVSLLILRIAIFGSISNLDNISLKNYFLCRKKKINLISSKKNVRNRK